MSGRDRGAATLLAVVLVQLLLIVGLMCWVVASLAITRQRVALVADVSALAAAQALGDPCARAGQAATDNGMRLASCVVEGGDVVVEVAADAPALAARGLSFLGRDAAEVTASARAGVP